MMALWAPGLGGDVVITNPTRSQLLRFSARHTPAHRGSQTLSKNRAEVTNPIRPCNPLFRVYVHNRR